MEELNPQRLHHTYILEGDKKVIYNKLCIFCEDKLLFKTKANPDFWYSDYDRFLVSDAKLLKEMQLKKTKGNSKKIFIISFNFITREAQNSLLKVLEEPTSGTHIFFITRSSHLFLDTVRSRAITLSMSSDRGNIEAEKFIELSQKERFIVINKFIEDIKKEKISKSDAIYFVQSIKEIIHNKFKKNPDKDMVYKLKEILKIEDYLSDNGSSTKILLEHLALNF